MALTGCGREQLPELGPYEHESGGEWRPVAKLDTLGRSDGSHTTRIRVRVPELGVADPAVHFKPWALPIEASLDGKPLPLEKGRWGVVPLPADHANKTLEVAYG